MNELWQILPLTSKLSTAPPPLFAQARGGNIFGGVATGLGDFLPAILAAVVILVVGIVLAFVVKAIVKGLLNRTDIDNRLAAWITGDEREQLPNVEEWIASAFFWLIIILTVVGVFQALQLTAVTDPLANFIDGIISFIPNILGAAILVVIAWFLAMIVKVVVTRALKAMGLDEKLGQQMRDDSRNADPSQVGTTPGRTTTPPSEVRTAQDRTQVGTPPGRTTAPSSEARRADWNSDFSLSETIGSALYWFIFLLFLPSILGALQLEGTLAPVQGLLNEILSILPNILAAIIIAAVGWLVAQIVRRIVTNLLIAAGTDRAGSKVGLTGRTPSQSLSWLIGTIIFVLILIPVAIAALNALQIQAIAAPAIVMLQQILNLIPRLFAAAVILAVAYIIGKYIADLVTNILASAGFDNIFQWMGLRSPRTRSTPAPEPFSPETGVDATYPEFVNPAIGGETTIQPEPKVSAPPVRTPSETVGIIVLVGIMLFATLAAVNILEIEAVTALVSGIILVAGQILAGLIVFAIGLYFANLAYNLIRSSSRQSRILAHTARIAIIALVTAMALQQIGIASDIVNLAFGLLFGAIAVAIAIAFGLGGREIAAQQVREWLDSFKQP